MEASALVFFLKYKSFITRSSISISANNLKLWHNTKGTRRPTVFLLGVWIQLTSSLHSQESRSLNCQHKLNVYSARGVSRWHNMYCTYNIPLQIKTSYHKASRSACSGCRSAICVCCRHLHYLLWHKWALLSSSRWLVVSWYLWRLLPEIPRQTSGSIRGSSETDRQMEGSETRE